MTSACLRQRDSQLIFSIEINCLAVLPRVRPAAQAALIKELTM
jgi:hypothetical protein